jgi:hypothetical protein
MRHTSNLLIALDLDLVENGEAMLDELGLVG